MGRRWGRALGGTREGRGEGTGPRRAVGRGRAAAWCCRLQRGAGAKAGAGAGLAVLRCLHPLTPCFQPPWASRRRAPTEDWTRVLIKQERRKQKEYFEKKKLRSKMKLLGVSSPVVNATASLDLLNLYMVNQISCKKKIPETMRKPVHVNMNRDIKMPVRKQHLELPVSPPCTPSNICIDDIENNICSQRLGSKKEHRPVQSFNVNYPHSSAPKLNENQDALRPPYPASAQFGTFFKRLNSPGSRRFHPGRSAGVMGEDRGSLGEKGQSVFPAGNQPASCIWGENRNTVSDFLEDVNQPTPSFLSENCDSLTPSNLIDLLNIDQQRMEKAFSRSGHGGLGGPCLVTAGSILTGPVSASCTSACSKTCATWCLPSKNYQTEFISNDGSHFSVPFEEGFRPVSSEIKGKPKNDSQENATQKGVQKCTVDHRSVAADEPHPTLPWHFALREVVMGGAGACVAEDGPASQKIFQDNYLASSQNSQSTSYSPRPTESCFSSSSDVPSEDEDLMLQQVEGPSGRSTSATAMATPGSTGIEDVTRCLPAGAAESSHGAGGESADPRLSVETVSGDPEWSQSRPVHVSQNRSNSGPVPATRSEAGVQTESQPVWGKRDAMVQCVLPCLCPCAGGRSHTGANSPGWPGTLTNGCALGPQAQTVCPPGGQGPVSPAEDGKE
ncbi:uncharacterized protein C12orf40 homolog isoform X2 [Erinaceus europaeus]|uniref:Uncharacterized protein C12orf40 homolog isoform X2 n=1 Tax=Erinaceus europaeus TaxID=9365 RepID=A0ABM3XPB4_ERIEU|nr:uncharacterized protein C12orf40 homolog isoform X2 [Erinaceus europaeus]